MKKLILVIAVLMSISTFAKNDRDDEIHRKMARSAYKMKLKEFNADCTKNVKVTLNEKTVSKDNTLESLVNLCITVMENTRAMCGTYSAEVPKVITSIDCGDKAKSDQLRFDLKNKVFTARMSGKSEDRSGHDAQNIMTLIEYAINPASNPANANKGK